MFLRPYLRSDSIFQALLPCCSRLDLPVTINLTRWESNYYRHAGSIPYEEVPSLQLHIRYQDTLHCNSTFEIDDSAIFQEGFSSSATLPQQSTTGNTVTLSTTDPLCVKRYSCKKEYDFAVGFGQCIGQNWTHVVCQKSDTISWRIYDLMLERAPEYGRSMMTARSGAAAHCQVYILQTRLPRSTWVLQTSRVIWKNSRMWGVKLDVFRDPEFSIVSGQWKGFDVEVSRLFFVHAYLIDIDIANRKQTVPTVTGGFL